VPEGERRTCADLTELRINILKDLREVEVVKSILQEKASEMAGRYFLPTLPLKIPLWGSCRIWTIR
jgi:hypothetical protein